ncbi:ATP-dependent Clp protease proteolytic subunit [Pacificimonas flava]|uniref:Peptidase S14 n=1 Tax=Pacificimonas flava TaxID=1234595 RepID=M2T5P1_9SPHN|nr:ATP-dependent Clp protease proteolytic subunit [Pacificimonas flava]EMD81799.1 hypothetical protein C725_2847 [Pacificimonas flava]MBB5281669.1 ATP-dependent protease ClpP protease subunit [Pacificimonas flava]
MSDEDRSRVLSATQIRLIGAVDEAMYSSFRSQLAASPTEGALVIAITTLGGNPEVARAMGDDVRLLSETGRQMMMVGKSAVYSAGATFMASFPIKDRYLTANSSLLLHERQMSKTVTLNGPLRSCTAQLNATLNEIKHSIEIEEAGFRALVEGSDITFKELQEKAPRNWYVGAEEALERGLIAGII